jgi:hypothetical protein
MANYNKIMVFFSLFFIELLVLFLLSHSLSRHISYFFYRLTKSKQFTISALAFLFFPGTLLHELSHAISAGLLGVHVGTIEFIPKIDGDHVKLGSVQIAQTDPFRRFFIGAAPFLFGTLILLGILFYAVKNNLFDNYLWIIFVGYLVFEIGNTMFSSRKDMEGALELFGTIIVILIVFYFLGIRLPAFNPNTILNQPLFLNVFRRGSVFLFIPIAIDTVIILLLRPNYKR